MWKVLVSDIKVMVGNSSPVKLIWKFIKCPGNFMLKGDDLESLQEKGEIHTCPQVPEAICWRKAGTS